MAPAEDRRAALLDAMADHMLAAGLAASTLRPLARAAGTSDRMLLYYFPTKDALTAAVLTHLSQRMAAQLSAGIGQLRLPADQLLPVLEAQTLHPQFRPTLALFLEIASRARRGDALCRTVGANIVEGFLAWIEAQLDAPPERARAEARAILVRIEGRVVLESFV